MKAEDEGRPGILATVKKHRLVLVLVVVISVVAGLGLYFTYRSSARNQP